MARACSSNSEKRCEQSVTEPDHIALDEQLDAENAASAQIAGDSSGDLLGFGQCRGCHGLRLPGFDVVTRNLNVADRFAEIGLYDAMFIAGADGEQGDFVVKFNHPFNNDAALIDPAATRRVIPGGLHILRTAQHRLSLA